ncbi:flotillin-1-like [Macrobrachium nipponense]|uniref:flotillin-1-like n=1 Tax=Macrobrachium nipponense TaxID=159736 RepID=UPI0030C8B22E
MAGFLTCGPNELLVVSGFGKKKPAMITGGRVFYWPGLQKCSRISLNVMTIMIPTPDVYTAQGVLISVTGITQVKISTQSKELLERACCNFLSKSKMAVIELIQETLEGHQRSAVSLTTVEDIYRDRQAFNTRMIESASHDMVNLGVEILSYTIHEVYDNLGYLSSLGKSRIAEIHRDARIGEALARRDARIVQSLAREKLVEAQLTNKTLMAQAELDFLCKKEDYEKEVYSQRAMAENAYELQAAKAKQKNMNEKMEIEVIDRRERVTLEEQETLRREKQLQSAVKQVADAEKYKTETLAAAEKQKTILEAEAEAEAIRLRGEAEAFLVQKRADRRSLRPPMNRKAEAWDEYRKGQPCSACTSTRCLGY